MDPFWWKFSPSGPRWWMALVAVLALAANVALWLLAAFAVGLGLSLGWHLG